MGKSALGRSSNVARGASACTGQVAAWGKTAGASGAGAGSVRSGAGRKSAGATQPHDCVSQQHPSGTQSAAGDAIATAGPENRAKATNHAESRRKTRPTVPMVAHTGKKVGSPGPSLWAGPGFP